MKTELETAVKSLVSSISGDVKSEDAMRFSQAALNLAHAGSVMQHTGTQKPQVTDEMVSRFLCWELPNDFYPDCHITFDRVKASNMWPTGTNLLHAGQVRAMLEHILNA